MDSITDDELRIELENMGYSGISDELFIKFKKDLLRLMENEQYSSFQSSSNKSVSTSPTVTHKQGPTNINNSYLNEIVPNQFTKKDESKTPKEISLKHKNISDSSSISSRILKRKTLRHNNGQSFIEEASFSCFISDSNETIHGGYDCEGKKTSHLNRRISRSTGNLFEKSKIKLPTVLPMVAYGSKHCDPVNRYHQYRKYWETHKTPSEKGHKSLRWNIREQMLDYDPIAEFSLKQMPNIFHIPKERRSNLYRWNSCSKLHDQ